MEQHSVSSSRDMLSTLFPSLHLRERSDGFPVVTQASYKSHKCLFVALAELHHHVPPRHHHQATPKANGEEHLLLPKQNKG